MTGPLSPRYPTNGEVFDWLVSEADGDPPTPPVLLAEWAAAIPGGLWRFQAFAALKRRFGVGRAPRFFRREPVIIPSWIWRAAPFDLPAWTLDPATGRRWRVSPAFVPEPGRAQTWPRKYYRMPYDLPACDYEAWLRGDPPYAEREAYAIWIDEDWYEYVWVAGQLVPLNDLEKSRSA